jgi:hypothetical protein
LAYPTYLKAPFLTSGTSKKIQFGLIAPGGAATMLQNAVFFAQRDYNKHYRVCIQVQQCIQR